MTQRRTSTRKPRGAWAAALALVALGPAAGDAVVLDGLVARVDSRVIMVSDLRVARELGLMPAAPSDEALVSRLVDRRLMLSEVERFQPPAPPETRVDQEVARLRARVGDSAWQASLRRNGVDEAYVRATIADDLRLDAYLRQRFGALAEPSDQDLRRAYEQRQASLSRDGKVPPFESVEAALRQDLQQERFTQLVDEWVAELRQRGEVSVRGIPGAARP